MLEAITNLKDELKQIGKWSVDEINQMLDNGIQKYVVNYQEKFGKTKTFIFRDERIDFYDIYFPLSLYNTNRKKTIKVPRQIDSLFKGSHCITILGNAGSGKTMLLRHCFLSTLKNSKQIPIIVELRRLNSYTGTLEGYIQEQVFSFKLAQNNHILGRLLENGNFTFMFDGFDELSLDTKEQRIRELDIFIDKYSNNYFLLSSRPGANAESLARFNNYHVCALTSEQIKEFIHLQLCMIEDECILERKMLEVISRPESQNYQTYLSSPLLLSMFILTFSTHPELPTLKSKFYYNVFDTLYSRHDTISKSGGYTHEKKTNLEKDKIENILKWFSYISYFESHFSFDKEYLSTTLNKVKRSINIDYNTESIIYDFSVAISVLILDGLDYSFPHRSLQEYFTAVLIKNLPEKIKKEKIYEVKLVQRKWDSDLNLWDLCNEVDNYCFNKYFIIIQLDSYIRILNNGSVNVENEKKLIFENYLKLSDTGLYFDKDKNFMGVNLPDENFDSLMSFLGLDPMILFNFFMTFPKDYFTEIEPYLERIDDSGVLNFVFYLSRHNRYNSHFSHLFEECGVYDKFYDFYKEMLIVRKKINDKLQQEYKNEEFLLDLV